MERFKSNWAIVSGSAVVSVLQVWKKRTAIIKMETIKA